MTGPFVALEPVDAVTITTLIDNVSDATLANVGPAKRPPLGGGSSTIATGFLEGGQAPDALLAEHGFSALVTVTKAGRSRKVLFDAGITPDGMTENMRRLDLSPKDVEAIVLSHGHWDHTTGLDGFVRAVGRANLPVMIHPEFWNRRRTVFPGREPFELPTTSKSALRGAGFEIIEERQPSFLLDRSVLLTGEVDRTTGYESGFPPQEKYEHDSWVPDKLVLDDQAVVMHVRDRGLLVMTGCGHAGIVNIVRYAQKLTSIDRIYAVIGGFHLGGPLFEPIIPDVCSALVEMAPEVILPAHCTGWRAVHTIAAALPDAFIQNSVGTRLELGAAP
jgi:7,8-dihydropterin-6-yl-methyl-4-(beta-D-ribofuranosyl)aminobenzene 5'-phosphate synthase